MHFFLWNSAWKYRLVVYLFFDQLVLWLAFHAWVEFLVNGYFWRVYWSQVGKKRIQLDRSWEKEREEKKKRIFSSRE